MLREDPHAIQAFATLSGMTALHVAAELGNAEAIQIILDHLVRSGTRTFAGSASSALTPPALAGLQQSLSQLRLPPESGPTSQLSAAPAQAVSLSPPPFDIPDSYGRTPLHYAVSQGHWSVARILLSAGADVFHVDPDGANLLHRAAQLQHGSLEMCALLLQPHGTSPKRQPQSLLLQQSDCYGKLPADYARQAEKLCDFVGSCSLL